MEDPAKWVYEKEYNSREYDTEMHERQRAERGFSTYDWWNFNSHLCYVIIGGLEKFKTGHGFPVYGGVETFDDWVERLDAMIEGFQARYTLDNEFCPDGQDRDEWTAGLEEKWKKGAELFITFFPSLWD